MLTIYFIYYFRSLLTLIAPTMRATAAKIMKTQDIMHVNIKLFQLELATQSECAKNIVELFLVHQLSMSPIELFTLLPNSSDLNPTSRSPKIIANTPIKTQQYWWFTLQHILIPSH